MSLVSWAKKEVDRFRLLNHKRLLLLPPAPTPTPTPPPVKEVVIAADLHCKKCQLRIADAISKMDGKKIRYGVHGGACIREEGDTYIYIYE